MYNRYLQTWCPGSTFKPVTGAIGLTSGKLSQDDEFSYNGLAWKKDASWGNYEITVSMVEDAKTNGGSHYLIKKLEYYLNKGD